jgi:site-specific recombinase XerD
LKANQFPLLLHAFFHDWLVQQRNVSHHTVLSYRDSWRLFLRFVAAQKTKSVARLGMDDLTAVEVLAFLKDIEQIRKSSIGTRNCRLSALHSFYRFVADREPLAAAQCAAVLRIPIKQAPVAEVRDLDEDEAIRQYLAGRRPAGLVTPKMAQLVEVDLHPVDLDHLHRPDHHPSPPPI